MDGLCSLFASLAEIVDIPTFFRREMSKFRLQTALKVRERLEKLYQKSFAEQVQVTQKLQDQLGVLQTAFEENTQAVNRAKHEGFTVQDLNMAQGFQQRLRYHEGIVQDNLSEQQEVLERRRQELVYATQQRRVLEILKENHHRREKERQRKLEIAELDEMALNLRRFHEKQ